MTVLLIYIALFAGAFFVVHQIRNRQSKAADFTSLKTVTFGDESAVTADRAASIVSIVAVFLIWAAFTGSKLIPLHVPGPFIGDTSFNYTLQTQDGTKGDAKVLIRVFPADRPAEMPEIEPGNGIAKNDVEKVAAWRSVLISVDQNDEVNRDDGANIVAINGQPLKPGDSVKVDNGVVTLSSKGTPNFKPYSGWQMEPVWLPAPEAVFKRLIDVYSNGYQNFTLMEHLGASLLRVVIGFLLGAIVGIPLGYAMGLSNWFRGWFDPIVEFMRPVPPLALIPLVIIWAGIGEAGKIILLFLASLWIMTIAARAGVSGVQLSKVHAGYSLGASKWRILTRIVVPNSLPEIFTGARVAMGVCWGTVVAAELVAAEKGAGMMIMVASRFQLTDIVIMGIILIGAIGYAIDILMRKAESVLVPWKGKG
ncbi:MAG: ABC transporter permease [Polaromonas sp.]